MPRLSLGVEHNPRANTGSALANLVAFGETRRRPALIFGTSSDRIGTPEGQAWFFTFSKDLSAWSHFPLSAYVGASFGTFEDEWKAVGGGRVGFGGSGASLGVIHDGKELHPTLDYRFAGGHNLSLMWVATENVGLAYSVAF